MGGAAPAVGECRVALSDEVNFGLGRAMAKFPRADPLEILLFQGLKIAMGHH